MLEKPSIPDELILARLQEEYGLHNARLTFLPLGADLGTAVYRVESDDQKTYFLKLRKGFEKITVTVPLFLQSLGVQEVIAPFKIKNPSEKYALGGVPAADEGDSSNFRIEKRYWADFEEYKMILYPFIIGQDGFERELTNRHRRILGRALRQIHAAQLPSELKSQIPREGFSPRWRESLKSLQSLAENKIFADPAAAKLAAFMKSNQSEITRIITRTEELASGLKTKPLEFVLCHTDVHGGNILISAKEDLYIVDWDNPLLAPRERDLMFIGGGIDGIWPTEREEAVFYEGYGGTEIDRTALAYYRYERIIEDLAVVGEQLLLSNEGGADRKRSFGWFRGNFEPGSTIEIADKTSTLL
jgi:spectinomycin phosphotransferase